MKRIAVVILLVGLTCLVYGQKTASEYFAKLPDIPGNCCDMDDSARAWYTDHLREISNELYDDIHARTEAAEDYMNAHRAEAEATAVKNAGFEVSDVEAMKKMDGKHMTEEEKAAMADKMMQKYMNMSMEEVKNLKKMDTAGQRRWAQAYATEKMADQESDPEKMKADQLKNKSNFDLLQKQRDLTEVMKARSDKFQQMFDSLQKVADTARAVLDRMQRPLYAQLDSGDLDDGQREAIEDQLYREDLSYCQDFNPKYCKIIADYKLQLFQSLIHAEYDTLENVQHRIMFSQMGVGDPLYKPGLYAVQAVQGYATLLGTVFKFSVGRRNQPISTSD
jgi:hypothetical protein